MAQADRQLFVDPALGTEVLTLLRAELPGTQWVSAPSDHADALIYLRDAAHINRLQSLEARRLLVVCEPAHLTRLLLLYPNVIHGFAFPPVNARVVSALLSAADKGRETDTSGSVQRLTGLDLSDAVTVYRRKPDEPYKFECLDSSRPSLDLSAIGNGELLYQGFSLAYQDGQLTPLELGAGYLAYSRAGLSRSLVLMAAGGILARQGRQGKETSPVLLPNTGFVPAPVFDFLVRKEAVRSERFRRPYTVLEVHLPYEQRVVQKMAQSVLELLRKTDLLCEPTPPTLRALCPETAYFDAFWMVHRIQERLAAEFFTESSLLRSLEKPTFRFWTYPETQTLQPDTLAYPRQLKDLLFPARREFWSALHELLGRFGAFVDTSEWQKTALTDLLATEASLSIGADYAQCRVFAHIGRTSETLPHYQMLLRHRGLRDLVDISGYIDDQPPAAIHTIPFQGINDPRTADLSFYTYQSQEHSYMAGSYAPIGQTRVDFVCDDPWIVDLMRTSFAHTYFLKNRVRR